jgi:hypothetical protein
MTNDTPLKPDGPRSDSRRHRVGLSDCSFVKPPKRLHAFASRHWSRADILGKLLPAWARLGPLSMNVALPLRSHRRLPANRLRGRSPKWGGGAVSRLDGRGISLSIAPRCQPLSQLARFSRSPGPVPRISRLSLLFMSGMRRVGSNASLVGGLSPRGAFETGPALASKTDPYASLAATLTRLACRALSSPLVPGGL